MKAVILCATLSLAATPAIAATVQVTVTGIRSDKGDILVAVCSKDEFLQPRCAHTGKAPAKAGSVRIDIDGVPPGVWAVQAFQDENGNGKIDRSFMGMPKEGMGFSRDAPMNFGPPRWDAAAFTLSPEGGALTLKLRYYD